MHKNTYNNFDNISGLFRVVRYDGLILGMRHNIDDDDDDYGYNDDVLNCPTPSNLFYSFVAITNMAKERGRSRLSY